MHGDFGVVQVLQLAFSIGVERLGQCAGDQLVLENCGCQGIILVQKDLRAVSVTPFASKSVEVPVGSDKHVLCLPFNLLRLCVDVIGVVDGLLPYEVVEVLALSHVERLVRQQLTLVVLGRLVPVVDGPVPQRHFARVCVFYLMAFEILHSSNSPPELLNFDNFFVKTLFLLQLLNVCNDLVDLQLLLRGHLADLD